MDVTDARCFVDHPNRGVTLLDLVADEDGVVSPQLHNFWDLHQLEDFFSRPEASRYVSRYISICQFNSWSSLEITRPMLDLLAANLHVDASLHDMSSYFYQRDLEQEEAVCAPFRHTQAGDLTEITYSIRYPEYKPEDEEWTMRQSAIYHRLNSKSGQDLLIVFNPNYQAAVDIAARDLLQNRPSELQSRGKFWLHQMLFSTHMPSWRRYIASLEPEFLPIANTTLASYIDEPLSLGYDHLSALARLERQLLLAATLLNATAAVLAALLDAFPLGLDPDATRGQQQVLHLRNHARQCAADSHGTAYLQQRARSTAQRLADTLALRDQASMLQLNKSAVFITALTLVYLPASFVGTFFGMNFFSMDTENSRIVGTDMVWIFFVVSAGMMGVTFSCYYWLLQEQDGGVLRRLAFKGMRVKT